MSQVVVITGASSGIGRATALEFARRGARLVLGSRHEGTAASLIKELGEGRAVFKQTDVTSEQDVEALVELAVERFGRLDVAINSAAVEAREPFADFGLETYERVFDTNVKGVCLAMWFEIAAMRHTGGGSIVNIGATSGSRGAPNMSLYAASKHAVEGLRGCSTGYRRSLRSPAGTVSRRSMSIDIA
jgi:NAD(P)-dependent dehydrogenase (short-subunit alcohol dehydrogenase family)